MLTRCLTRPLPALPELRIFLDFRFGYLKSPPTPTRIGPSHGELEFLGLQITQSQINPPFQPTPDFKHLSERLSGLQIRLLQIITASPNLHPNFQLRTFLDFRFGYLKRWHSL